MTTYPVAKGFYVTSPFGPRAGGYHWGTDFGRGGGSGGHPVYAVKRGTVTRAGAASGFGRWVTIDHPASNGGGETVYGHIIPEVHAGQKVREGQRIGRIDPNSATNGGVAPHLHFEWHKYSWSPPGPNRLNPEHMLRGAKWVGDEAPAPKPSSSREIFGVDVSEHQDGMSLKRAKDEGIEFAILRICDGTYADKVFHSHLEDAESAGLLVSTYWYLRAPSEGSSIAQQVDVIDQQMRGRRDLSVWIDVESVDGYGRKLLTGKDVWAAKRELEKRGYTVAGIYSGAWYWEHIPGGEPSMQGLGNLWVSHYGDRNAYGPYRTIYTNEGGGNHTGWSHPLGDRLPDILQYGSNGYVAGKYVDVNAFKGTRDDLARVFGYTPKAPKKPKPKTTFLEELMAEKVKSFVNETKEFTAPVALSIIDRQVWETRVLLLGLYKALGINPHALIGAAITADNEGRDINAAISDAVAKHKEVNDA